MRKRNIVPPMGVLLGLLRTGTRPAIQAHPPRFSESVGDDEKSLVRDRKMPEAATRSANASA
jgi:hypothetical protein